MSPFPCNINCYITKNINIKLQNSLNKHKENEDTFIKKKPIRFICQCVFFFIHKQYINSILASQNFNESYHKVDYHVSFN